MLAQRLVTRGLLGCSAVRQQQTVTCLSSPHPQCSSPDAHQWEVVVLSSLHEASIAVIQEMSWWYHTDDLCTESSRS